MEVRREEEREGGRKGGRERGTKVRVGRRERWKEKGRRELSHHSSNISNIMLLL